jgi:pimeloyl-ACP methyl ester carboxylesterase
VVAIHCSASSPRQWKAYGELLDPGVEFHAPRLLGYGNEDVEWVSGSPVTLEAEARHLLPALQAAGQPAHLVAHSYGGAVAIQAALLWPSLVRSLTVYEPTLFHLLEQDSRSVVQAEEIRGVARRLALLSLSGRRAEAAELFVDYWSGPGSWVCLPGMRRDDIASRMAKVRAEFEALFHSRLDLRKLQQAGVPVRVLHGDASPPPAQRVARLLREQLPSAEVIALRGQRHMAPVQDPATLAPWLFPHALRGEERLAA